MDKTIESPEMRYMFLQTLEGNFLASMSIRVLLGQIMLVNACICSKLTPSMNFSELYGFGNTKTITTFYLLNFVWLNMILLVLIILPAHSISHIISNSHTKEVLRGVI